ncbi:MAG: DUF1854 domain-containing protein, partial [Verrucomicrobiaceae bacterium]
MAEIRYVDGTSLRVTRPEGAIHLRLEVEGEYCIPNARIRRAFPLSTPDQHLSLQGSDGKEIAMLRGIESVEASSRRLLDEEL